MLEEKRQKIRLIQQRKLSEKDQQLLDLKDLPPEIPLTLSIGHRVYAHICNKEAAGVFLGTIRAIDPCEHTYRVVFDRASIGSHTVYDFEIKSLTPIQTIPTKAYLQTYRPPKPSQPITPNYQAGSFSATNTPLYLSSIIPPITPSSSITAGILTPNQNAIG